MNRQTKRALTAGAPLILLVVGGSVLLGNIRRGRNEIVDEHERQLARADTHRGKEFNLEEEYKVLYCRSFQFL